MRRRRGVFFKQLRYVFFPSASILVIIILSGPMAYYLVVSTSLLAALPTDFIAIDIIGWIYAGSITLLAALFFLAATLESQEKIQFYKGFYIIYPGIFWSLLLHVAIIVFFILNSTMPILSQVGHTLVVANAFFITFSMLNFASIFIFPSQKDAEIRRFLKIKLDILYALHKRQQQKYTEGQEHIDRIFQKYGINRSASLRPSLRHTPIASGKSGYMMPRKKDLKRIGRKIKRGVRKIPASNSAPVVQHSITFGKRIGKSTSLLFVFEATDKLKNKLPRWLHRHITCASHPEFLHNDYITTMENFREALLQTESVERFQFYRTFLQDDLLYRYIDNDYSVEEKGEKWSTSNAFLTGHSIIAWYHRIAEALIKSNKAGSAEWTGEIVALYREPIYYLCNSTETPFGLLQEFLNQFNWRYFEAGRHQQEQTVLQQRIMRQYDAFLVSLCDNDQKIEAAERKIASMIIKKQAEIIKNLYDENYTEVFKRNVYKFMNRFSIGNDFTQKAFQSIDSIIDPFHRLSSGNDTVQGTFEEYCLFQKETVLFGYASYIFATKELSVTASEDADSCFAFLVDGFPTSLIRFIYLYCVISQDPVKYPGYRVREDWERSDSIPSIKQSLVIHSLTRGNGMIDFFLWYGINKCENDHPPLSDEQVPLFFPLPFRREAEQHIKRLEEHTAHATLTDAQKAGAERFATFLHTLLASYNQERHHLVISSTLNEKSITEVTNAFQNTYQKTDADFLRVLEQQQIAIAELKPIPSTLNAKNAAVRTVRYFHEKISYIDSINDGVGRSTPTNIFTSYARSFIDAKIDLIWQRWKQRVPQIPHTAFFKALREPNFTAKYIVVCNSVSTLIFQHGWRNAFPAPQFNEVFIPYWPDLNNSNDSIFFERIGDIQSPHDSTDPITIPVACFRGRNSGRTPITFIILERQKWGTFQQYSLETAQGALRVNDHCVQFQITDLSQDTALRNKILKKPPDFMRQGAEENPALFEEEYLKERVCIDIADAFEFECPAIPSDSLCGYIECDFS